MRGRQPTNEVSIAEAMDHLDKLVTRAEGGEAIRLTRQGRTVALLVSQEAYRKSPATESSFRERYESFRRTHDLDRLDIDVGVFDEARERSKARRRS